MNLELFITEPVYFVYKIIQWTVVTYISLSMYATTQRSLPNPMHTLNMIKKNLMRITNKTTKRTKED